MARTRADKWRNRGRNPHAGRAITLAGKADRKPPIVVRTSRRQGWKPQYDDEAIERALRDDA